MEVCEREKSMSGACQKTKLKASQAVSTYNQVISSIGSEMSPVARQDKTEIRVCPLRGRTAMLNLNNTLLLLTDTPLSATFYHRPSRIHTPLRTSFTPP
jgi:hypothetical protein